MKLKRGTLSKKGKPTRFSVELYLKYFELGGDVNDQTLNPFISARIQELMGWENEEGVLCLHWGLHSKTQNSVNSGYYAKVMRTAKEIAWDIHTKCA